MITLLFSPLGRLGLAAAGVAVFLTWFAFDQRSKGAAKAVAVIEKANSHDVKKAQTAGAKSRSGTGGVLDPYTVNEN